MKKLHPFQIALAIASLVPIFGGVWGMIEGAHLATPALESHYHYLSGLLLGIGLGFMSCVKDPWAHTDRFRLLAFIVVAGGVARLLYAAGTGTFDGGIAFSLFMELIVTPLMVYWQSRLRTV